MSEPARVLTKLAAAMVSRADQQPLTWRLCDACRQVLGADGAAITVENTSMNRMTVAATDEVIARVENLQDVLGEGPGFDAFVQGVAVVTGLGSEAAQRWPMFADALGFGDDTARLYALPMRPGSQILGVLTLMRSGGELAEGLETAQFLSDALGAALLRDPRSQVDYGEGGPWSERAEIHQATGMVCAQLRVSAEDALALLKAHAYAHEVDLPVVARLITTRRLDFRGGTDL